ncbi:MAG: OmpA family protein [Bacteroidales bacterium]|nr:OmpA family protein [Bacteroidales bacterium]
MSYKNIIITGNIILLIIFSNITNGQRIKLSKTDSTDMKVFRETKKNIRKGNHNYRKKTKGTYILAIKPYLKAYEHASDNAALNYKIGKSYLNSIQRAECLNYLKKAYELNNYIAYDILYDIAQGYHLNYEFDKAIEQYTAYKNILTPKDLLKQLNKIQKRIEECDSAKNIINKPVRVIIENLGDTINSPYPDYSPSISTDESVLFFTSRREDTYREKLSPRDNQFFEDIYFTEKVDKQWQKAKNIGKPLNKKNNDAVVGLSPDGQQIIIFKGKYDGGNLYSSRKKGTKWTKPTDKPFKRFINTKYHETSVSFSFDGRAMYFVSDRKDMSYGGRDIFISYWNKKRNRWDKPSNIGSTINTKYDEEGVFLHPNGSALYFSSKGHNTMGGYDIFVSYKDDNGQWTKPENIGYPVNSPDDELFFVINSKGRRGYYSSASNEESSGNYDILMVTFLGPEKPLVLSGEDNLIASIAKPITETVIEKTVEIKKIRLTILQGIITDAISGEPVETEIDVVDNQKNELIMTSSSNSSTGNYLISLPSGKNYGIAIKAEDYLFHSENIVIPPTVNYQEITKNIILHKIAVGSKIILANVFFEFGKSNLSPESGMELGRIVKLMNDYSTIKIEISGHTDNVGSLSANTRISEARAKSVIDFLIDKGIDSNRLEYVGQAYKFPVATNDTEEGRQKNRRVEFLIIAK